MERAVGAAGGACLSTPQQTVMTGLSRRGNAKEMDHIMFGPTRSPLGCTTWAITDMRSTVPAPPAATAHHGEVFVITDIHCLHRCQRGQQGGRGTLG